MRTIIQLSILSSTLERLDAWVAARALPGRGVAIGTLLDIAEEGRDRPGEPCPAPGCRLDAGHEGDHRRGRWLKSLRGRSDNEAPSRNRQSSTETGGERPVNESSQLPKTQQFQAVGTCTKFLNCLLGDGHDGPCFTKDGVDAPCPTLGCLKPAGHRSLCMVDSSPAGSPAPIVNESSRDSPDIPDDQVRAGDMLKVTDEGLLAKAIGSQGDNAIVPVARAFEPAASSAAAEAAEKLLSAPHRVSEESWSTYQRLLNQLCVRFGLAGSPSWDEALNQLAAKLGGQWRCEKHGAHGFSADGSGCAMCESERQTKPERRRKARAMSNREIAELIVRDHVNSGEMWEESIERIESALDAAERRMLDKAIAHLRKTRGCMATNEAETGFLGAIVALEQFRAEEGK